MSFTIVEPCPARLNRSELAVPGSNPRFLEKATQSPADVILLDLEDAVAPDDKVQARKNVIEALNDKDWGNKTLSVRINTQREPNRSNRSAAMRISSTRLFVLKQPGPLS